MVDSTAVQMEFNAFVDNIVRRTRYNSTPIRYGQQFIDQHYTVREAAARLGISKAALRARIRSGKQRATKVADMWFIDKACFV